MKEKVEFLAIPLSIRIQAVFRKTSAKVFQLPVSEELNALGNRTGKKEILKCG
jgi:hypothetical protein